MEPDERAGFEPVRGGTWACALVVFSVGSAMLALDGQIGPADRKVPPGQSVAKLSAALRAEAAKLAGVSRSKLFADLGDVEIAKKLGLSAEQREQAGRLDELTRDVIRAWLLRDLEAMPPPSATVLAARLSDRGERFRARLVAHAESIAIEGILSPDQARSWRKAAGRRAQPLLPARWSLVPPRPIDEPQPTADLVAELLAANPGSGLIFGMLLQEDSVVLSSEQQTVLRRLDQLRLAIMLAWLRRGLDGKTLPPWAVLFERVAWKDRVNASVRAHAEAIALEGILTPEQADEIVRGLWKGARLLSLLDPQLAARLRLSPAQQEQVRILLYGKAVLGVYGPVELTQAAPLLKRMPDGAVRREQMIQDFRNRLDEQDAMIWDVLTTAQARELARILGLEKEPGRRPAEKRKKSSRPS
jgi:hypothetical protein